MQNLPTGTSLNASEMAVFKSLPVSPSANFNADAVFENELAARMLSHPAGEKIRDFFTSTFKFSVNC